MPEFFFVRPSVVVHVDLSIRISFFSSFFDVILLPILRVNCAFAAIFVWIFGRKVSIKHQFIIHHIIDIARRSISCFQSYSLASLAPMIGSIKSWTKPITFFFSFFSSFINKKCVIIFFFLFECFYGTNYIRHHNFFVELT